MTTSIPPFDTLLKWAKNDPDKLTQLRLKMSQEVIENAPSHHQERLNIKLDHINRLIKKGKNPNHVNVLLMKALREQCQHWQEAWKNPERIPCAKVLPFSSEKPHKDTKELNE